MSWFQSLSDNMLRRFVIDADGVLLRYKGRSSHVTIPDKVTAIGEGAFANQEQLESVTIPESVRTIMDKAFQRCGRLSVLHFSEGLEIIGANAFAHCSLLRELKIPVGCHTIGKKAFQGCSSIQKITLPGGLRNIGADAFAGCSELIEIALPSSVDNLEAGVFARCRSLCMVTLPKHLQILKEHTFADCTSLEAITIPAEVRSIGIEAFSGCTALQSVTLPELLMQIGESSFQKCTSLKAITLPSGIRSICAGAFTECSSLEQVQLREGLLHIRQASFESCTSLREITLPEGLETVEDHAFRDCTALESIRIPESVYQFGEHCFSGTPWLTQYPEEMVVVGKGILLKYLGHAKRLEIPAAIRAIPPYAFSEGHAPKTMVLSESVEQLGWDYIPGLELIFCRKEYNTSLMMYDRYRSFGRDEERVLRFWETKNAVRRHLIFFEMRDPVYKFPLAVLMHLSDPEDMFFEGYVSRNMKDILKNMIVRNDLENLEQFMNRGYVTEENIGELIDYAIAHAQKTGNMEPQIALMDYKGRAIGYQNIADIFEDAFEL